MSNEEILLRQHTSAVIGCQTTENIGTHIRWSKYILLKTFLSPKRGPDNIHGSPISGTGATSQTLLLCEVQKRARLGLCDKYLYATLSIWHHKKKKKEKNGTGLERIENELLSWRLIGHLYDYKDDRWFSSISHLKNIPFVWAREKDFTQILYSPIRIFVVLNLITHVTHVS